MQPWAKYNKGFKYLLAVIDVFSKYGFMVPLKDKKGPSVASAFEKIFTTSGRIPNKLWTDKGKEFYNRPVAELLESRGNITLYSTENEEKSSVAERWNRTMKERMFKYFSSNNTNVYIDILQDLVSRYNNTKHSALKMTPLDASQKKNESKVYKNLYGNLEKRSVRPKFMLGDYVRIAKRKGKFSKGYIPRWTEEIFQISEVQNTVPVTYKLKDLNNEDIKGSFYEKELQKTKQDTYRIEKVLRRKGNEILVKWQGYGPEFNSWIPADTVEKL